MTRRRFQAAARRLGRLAHLYQCARCQAWTESPTCQVCPPA
ncbi:hypothetical protein OG927_35860 (plasmid) [Streptomyces clavifer]|nr:hypothetical protein [Streptomyces clavifer]WUC32705.1 hypothetical protein OG927_35860 [Streptomyces clavifer]